MMPGTTPKNCGGGCDEGYLFFKRLQDPDKLWALRREMLTVMQQGGWLVAGTDPVDGIANVCRPVYRG